MKDGKHPNPNTIHPIAGYDKEIYVKPTITNPNIIVGDFTYIADSDFESHVYNPPFCERHRRGYETGEGAFAVENCLLYCPRRCSANYTDRGGEWRGCIAATSHIYMVRPPVKASTNGASK